MNTKNKIGLAISRHTVCCIMSAPGWRKCRRLGVQEEIAKIFYTILFPITWQCDLHNILSFMKRSAIKNDLYINFPKRAKSRRMFLSHRIYTSSPLQKPTIECSSGLFRCLLWETFGIQQQSVWTNRWVIFITAIIMLYKL